MSTHVEQDMHMRSVQLAAGAALSWLPLVVGQCLHTSRAGTGYGRGDLTSAQGDLAEAQLQILAMHDILQQVPQSRLRLSRPFNVG